MASVLLKRDYKSDRGSFKAGETISVPLLLARQMEADGTAHHPVEVQPGPKGKTIPLSAKPAQSEKIVAGSDARDAEIAALKQKLEEAQADLAEMTAPKTPAKK